MSDTEIKVREIMLYRAAFDDYTIFHAICLPGGQYDVRTEHVVMNNHHPDAEWLRGLRESVLRKFDDELTGLGVGWGGITGVPPPPDCPEVVAYCKYLTLKEMGRSA